jgi:hypothetical protein
MLENGTETLSYFVDRFRDYRGYYQSAVDKI